VAPFGTIMQRDGAPAAPLYPAPISLLTPFKVTLITKALELLKLFVIATIIGLPVLFVYTVVKDLDDVTFVHV
jgi:hypothetical protein